MSDMRDGHEPSSPSEMEGWRELAEKASQEGDPNKLLALVQRLCDALDQERGARASPHSPHPNKAP